jgi:hypothetical protein
VTDKQRILASLAAVPLGVGVGFVVGIFIIGAPHAIPGPLLKAPESVRSTVHLAVMAGTPVLFLVALWVGPMFGMFTTDGVHPPAHASNPRASTQIETTDLAAAFRKKSTPELEALLATRRQSIYPARTYQLAEEVIKERRTSEAS